MGFHVHSIFRISPEDKRNVYVFVYGIPPWNDAYLWFQEKFISISQALGVEGLIVMADGESSRETFEAEIVEAYQSLDNQIRNLHAFGAGLIVTNVNPNNVKNEERKSEDQLYYIPLRMGPQAIGYIVSIVVKAAQSGDLSQVKELSEELNANTHKSLLRIFAESILLEPNFIGLGFDFGKLFTQLAERRDEHKAKWDRFK